MSEFENKPGINPENYFWGIFYYNSNDNRLFVPKRLPILGWTLNFAKPLAYLILVPILILCIAAIISK